METEIELINNYITLPTLCKRNPSKNCSPNNDKFFASHIIHTSLMYNFHIALELIIEFIENNHLHPFELFIRLEKGYKTYCEWKWKTNQASGQFYFIDREIDGDEDFADQIEILSRTNFTRVVIK